MLNVDCGSVCYNMFGVGNGVASSMFFPILKNVQVFSSKTLIWIEPNEQIKSVIDQFHAALNLALIFNI